MAFPLRGRGTAVAVDEVHLKVMLDRERMLPFARTGGAKPNAAVEMWPAALRRWGGLEGLAPPHF